MLTNVSDGATVHEADDLPCLLRAPLPTGAIIFLLLDTEAVLVLEGLLSVVHFLTAFVDQCGCLVKLMFLTQTLL